MADVEKTVGVVYEGKDAGAAAEAKRQADALGKVGKAGEQAGVSLEKAGDASKRAQTALRGMSGAVYKADGRLEAMGKQAASARKAIDGMAAGLAGLAAAFGASKLLEIGEEGGALQVIRRNLQEIGVTADQVSDIAARLGGGSISQIELLISRVDAMGVSFDEMGGLADAALRISIERGEDSHVIFNKLIRAIATGKQTYLQQLGITLDLKQAWDDYAKSIGKTRQQLSETEKSQVSSRLAIEELNKAFAGQAPDKYASNLGEVRDRFNNLNDSIKRMVADSLADLGAVLGGGLFGANFASGPQKTRGQQAQAQLQDLLQLMNRLQAARAASPAATMAVIEEAGRAAGIQVETALEGVRTVREEYDGTVRDVVEVVEIDMGRLAALAERVQGQLAGAIAAAAKRSSKLTAEELKKTAGETEDDVVETGKQIGNALLEGLADALRADAADSALQRLALSLGASLEGMPDTGASFAAAILPEPEEIDVLDALTTKVMGVVGAVRDAAVAFYEWGDGIMTTLGLADSFSEAMAPAEGMLKGLGEAMAANIVQAIFYGESLQQMAAQALTALRDQAATEAIFQTAKGFAALATSVFYPPAGAAATAHFAAAGTFAGIGLAAGLGAAALGGGGGSAADATRAENGTRGAPRGASDFTSPEATSSGGGVSNYNFYGDVYDTREGAEMAYGARATQAIARNANLPGGPRIPAGSMGG